MIEADTAFSADVAYRVLDYAGVGVFAATGALAAAHKKQTIITFMFFAAITGIGGGTLRDLLIGAPVFWVQDNGYIAMCLAAAVTVWFFAPGRFGFRALLWLDALGLAAYPIIGAAKAAAFGVAPLGAIVMGVLSACFGGIIRDVLAEEPSILLRPEVYVTAAILSASGFVLLGELGLDPAWAGTIGFALGFGVRACALRFGWKLPGYRGA